MATTRRVVAVELHGEIGKEKWRLALECGHFAWRRPKRAHAHLFARGIPSEPPRRVRCIWCELIEATSGAGV